MIHMKILETTLVNTLFFRSDHKYTKQWITKEFLRQFDLLSKKLFMSSSSHWFNEPLLFANRLWLQFSFPSFLNGKIKSCWCRKFIKCHVLLVKDALKKFCFVKSAVFFATVRIKSFMQMFFFSTYYYLLGK